MLLLVSAVAVNTVLAWTTTQSASADCKALYGSFKNTEPAAANHANDMKVVMSTQYGDTASQTVLPGQTANFEYDKSGPKNAGSVTFKLSWVTKSGTDSRSASYNKVSECEDPETPAPTQAPTKPATAAPTAAPTQAATQAPTKAPTAAPTQEPTEKATDPATQASTQAPTQKATDPATKPATEPPATKPATKSAPKPFVPPVTVCEIVVPAGTVGYHNGDPVVFRDANGNQLGPQTAVRSDKGNLIFSYVKGDSSPAGFMKVYIGGVVVWTLNNCIPVQAPTTVPSVCKDYTWGAGWTPSNGFVINSGCDPTYVLTSGGKKWVVVAPMGKVSYRVTGTGYVTVTDHNGKSQQPPVYVAASAGPVDFTDLTAS